MVNAWPSNTELRVLRLLQDEPKGMYGLQLVESSDGTLKQGSVYVVLGRLEEKGFIRAKRNCTGGHAGLPRPLYFLTALGQRAIDAADVMELHPERA